MKHGIEHIEMLDIESFFQLQPQLSISENAYLCIQTAIILNKLPGGTWLSEEALSVKLSVSRTPLRDALQKLLSMELIERGLNGRLYVKPLSIKEARDIYSVRQSLEDLSLMQAFDNLTNIGLLELETDLEKMKEAGTGNETNLVGERGKEFHDRIMKIASNDVTKSLIDILQPRFDRYRYVSTSTGKTRTAKAVQEHYEIFNALKNNELALARKTMYEHLENSKRNVIEAIRQFQLGKEA